MNFVIVGTGNIASTYIAAIERIPEAEVVGFVSRGLDGRERGERGGYRPARPARGDERRERAVSLEALQSDFEAVILATPPGLHHEGAVAAARLGKHVLTEKPLDVTAEHMDTMIATCRRQGVKLGVAYQRRMSPDNQSMKMLLERRALGRLYAADLQVKFWRDQAYYDSAPYRGTYAIDGGGPFIQQASHNIDLYTWFFGMPTRVMSMLGTFAHDIEVEDHGACLLRHEDGMIGTIVASTAARPGFAPRLEIHAERGSVVMENDIITTWEVDGVANPSRPPSGAIHSGASMAVTDTAGHEAIIRDFIDAVRNDRDPAVSGESARLASDLILQIYAAAC